MPFDRRKLLIFSVVPIPNVLSMKSKSFTFAAFSAEAYSFPFSNASHGRKIVPLKPAGILFAPIPSALFVLHVPSD